MTTITSLIGANHKLQIGEETIELKPVTLEVEAEFEQRLLAKTKASLATMKTIVTPDEYIQLLKAITDSYALGQYKLLSTKGLEAIQTIDGLLILGSILTGKPEKDVLKLVKEHGAEFGASISAVLSDSLGVAVE